MWSSCLYLFYARKAFSPVVLPLFQSAVFNCSVVSISIVGVVHTHSMWCLYIMHACFPTLRPASPPDKWGDVTRILCVCVSWYLLDCSLPSNILRMFREPNAREPSRPYPCVPWNDHFLF
jgi:hypothetical protein